MSLIRRSWRVDTETDVEPDHAPAGLTARLHERMVRRQRDRAATQRLRGSIVSLAALLGAPVTDSLEKRVGTVADVVVHWSSATDYPQLSWIVVRSGSNEVLISARWVQIAPPASVRLRSSAVYAHAVQRRPADVALAHDVLDRQVVDLDGMQLVRPADLYLVNVDGRVELVGVEVGVGALLRRVGPRRWRSRVRPARVIDWKMVRAFVPARLDGGGRGRRSDLAGESGAGLGLAVTREDLRQLRASQVQAALEAALADRGGLP